jgi:hypothetical protein
MAALIFAPDLVILPIWLSSAFNVWLQQHISVTPRSLIARYLALALPS